MQGVTGPIAKSLLTLLAVRPIKLREAQWPEFDLNKDYGRSR